jgi:prophage regulatory protein
MREKNKNAMWRIWDMRTATGLSKSTIYERIKLGLLPPSVRLAEQAVGWPSDEICKIIAAQIAGHSDDVIKALVSRLVQDRQMEQGI